MNAPTLKKTVPAPSCWDKFAAIINKINAIGDVPMKACAPLLK